ncbi:MAG: VCBS domain-containing protein, partial [Paracoccaceae bacterium]
VNGVWVQRDVSAIDYDFAGGTSEYVADLQYADITTNLVGGTLAENQTLDIDLEVTNTGLQGARGITTFYWSQDGTLDVGEFVELGTDDHFNVKAGELDANEGKTFTYETILEKIEDAGLDAGAAGGTLIAVLDADDLVDEGAGGEANNTTSVAMAIDELEGADLIISTGEVSRTTVADGQRVSVTYTVENVGDEEVISRTKFYWSDDDTFDIGDTLLGIDSNGTMRVGQDKGQSDKFGYSELSSLAGSQGFIIGVVEVKTGNPEADDTNNTWVSDAITVEKDGNAPVVFDGGISDTEGTVTEDGGLVVGGALVATDADAFDVITWSGGSTSDYGTMTIDAGGNWSYTLDNDADALNLLDTGAEVADVFIFEATDGDGSTIQATVGIIVHGADEAVLDFTGAAGASFGGYDWVNHTFANDAVEGQFTVSDAAAFDFVSFTVDTSDDVTLTVTGGTGIGAQSVSVDLVGALVDEAVTIDLNGFTEYEVTAVGAGAGDFVIDDLILV